MELKMYELAEQLKELRDDKKAAEQRVKDINAEIEDRLPITRDPEIKIQALDLQGAEYEEESGKLHGEAWKRMR
mgnify:CR=1 FL=1